jgi:hypothetical protein
VIDRLTNLQTESTKTIEYHHIIWRKVRKSSSCNSPRGIIQSKLGNKTQTGSITIQDKAIYNISFEFLKVQKTFYKFIMGHNSFKKESNISKLTLDLKLSKSNPNI